MLRPTAIAALLLCTAPGHAIAAPKTTATHALKKLATAYAKFEAFSLSTTEEDFYKLSSENTPAIRSRTHFLARFSRDGRIALRADEGGRLGVSWTQVYDGQTFISSMAGRPEKRVPAKAFEAVELKPKFFCLLSLGERMIGELLQDGHLDKPFDGTMSAVSLPDGSVVLTSRGRRIDGKTPFALTDRLTLRPDGTLALCEREKRNAGVVWWKSTIQFSRPQELTLARPFAWETFRFPPNPKLTLTPEARAVLERSANFYGELKTLRLGFKTTIDKIVDDVPSHQLQSGEVAFDRRGRLRFQSSFSDSTSVYDGQHRIFRIGDQTQVAPDHGKLNAVQVLEMLDMAEADVPTWVGLASPLADLLNNYAPAIGDIDPSDVSWAAVLAPTAELDGIKCDVVFVKRQLAPYWTGANRELEYWFAQDNGRLVRVETRVRREKGGFNSADTQVENQIFDAVLPETLWHIDAPKAGK